MLRERNTFRSLLRELLGCCLVMVESEQVVSHIRHDKYSGTTLETWCVAGSLNGSETSRAIGNDVAKAIYYCATTVCTPAM